MSDNSEKRQMELLSCFLLPSCFLCTVLYLNWWYVNLEYAYNVLCMLVKSAAKLSCLFRGGTVQFASFFSVSMAMHVTAHVVHMNH